MANTKNSVSLQQIKHNKTLMTIDLTQFEQQIDEKILKLGLKYFKQGKVLDVSNEGDGVVVAEIEGSSENYTTYLQVKSDIVVDSRCSCPYDFGPVCKHVVALIFHLQQDELGITISVPKPKKEKIHKEKELERPQIAPIYQPSNNITSKNEYSKTLSSEINYLKRSGFIDYRAAQDLSRAFMNMCATAEYRITCGDYISAINAASATIEQAIRASGFTDDSDGCIGDAICLSLEILKNISEAGLDARSRKYLLRYVHKLIEQENKSGIGYDTGLIDVAINLIETSSEKHKVRKLIERDIADNSEWRGDESKELMARFIATTEGSEQRMNYIISNLDVDSFRDEFACILICSREYNKALELLLEALKNKYSTNKNRWKTLLLEIYTAQGDKANIIKTAQDFILNGSEFPIKTYYELLRSNIAEQDWDKYIRKLYCDVRRSYGRWGELAMIDKNWEQYLDFLSERYSYYSFEGAHKILPKEYYPQFIEIYCAKIFEAVPEKTGREHHRDIVRAIRRVNKLADKCIVDKLVNELRVKYKARRTLIEELDKI